MNAGQIAGLIWDIAAWLLLASVVAAPFVVLVQRCRARSKRLFVDEPLARIKGLHPSHTNQIDHRWDSL